MFVNAFYRIVPVVVYSLLSLAAPVFAEAPADQGQQLALAVVPKGLPPEVAAMSGDPGDSGKGSRHDGTDWHWRRASVSEYVGSSLALAGTLYSESAYGNPARAQWTARNGFDEGIRDGLRLRSNSAREAADTVSDILMGVMIAAPVLEPLATLGIRDGNWDAMWQTEVINLESFVFTGLVSSVMANTIRRERPLVRNCVNGSCAGEEALNRSMPSGHEALAFTGAGLICTHHAYQHLYGDPERDRDACAVALGLATATGVLRIMADRHYATDVAVGTLIGLFSGFALPRLLHYSWQSDTDLESGATGRRDALLVKQVTVAPQVLNGGAALKCDITF